MSRQHGGDNGSFTGSSSGLRQDLIQEIEETRLAFHDLLAEVPDEALLLPSDNPAWNVGQVLYHMSLAPRMMGADVRLIINHVWLMRLIPRVVPQRLFDWLNARLTGYGARNMSREFLAAEYDKAHAQALQSLDSLAEEDFVRRVVYPNWDLMISGEITVERLFHYIKDHFEAHAAQIRTIVGFKT